jgi:hypothetical protein
MYYFVATSMMIKVGVYTVEHPRKKEKKANKQERERGRGRWSAIGTRDAGKSKEENERIGKKRVD